MPAGDEQTADAADGSPRAHAREVSLRDWLADQFIRQDDRRDRDDDEHEEVNET